MKLILIILALLNISGSSSCEWDLILAAFWRAAAPFIRRVSTNGLIIYNIFYLFFCFKVVWLTFSSHFSLFLFLFILPAKFAYCKPSHGIFLSLFCVNSVSHIYYCILLSSILLNYVLQTVVWDVVGAEMILILL